MLFDVIEHLPQPRETLALCCQHLNPGGIIVITTGDFGSPAARLAGARWRLMTPPQHLWFFTRESMRRLSRSRPDDGAPDHPWKIVPASLIAFQLRRMLGLRGQGVTSASRIGGAGKPVRRHARGSAQAGLKGRARARGDARLSSVGTYAGNLFRVHAFSGAKLSFSCNAEPSGRANGFPVPSVRRYPGL